MVLGALDFYEKTSKCDGLVVDFSNKGVYYEPQYGPSWWEYYFERICLHKNGPLLVNSTVEFTDACKAYFADEAQSKISREHGHDLIKKYIHLKPHIEDQLDIFTEKYFAGNYVIGIHYRGTDKVSEAPTMSYEEVFNYIHREITLKLNAKFFVATDDAHFLNFMHAKFPGKIITLDAMRSYDQNPVHYALGNGYRKGKEALLDCLLLSRCAKLYKMCSNLSDSSLIFNPSLPVIHLNPIST